MGRGEDVRAGRRHVLGADRPCTRNSDLAQAEDDGAGEPVEGHDSGHLRAEPFDDLGHDVRRPSSRWCRRRSRRRRPAAATPPDPSPARPAAARDSCTAATSVGALRRLLVALAPAGPLLVAGGEEHLHRRVGEHDRPDVAALDHAAAVLVHPRPLPRDEHASGPRGCAETVDTVAVTSGPRISALTSRPSSRTISSSSSMRASLRRSAPQAAASARSAPARSAASVTDRYIAPVSSTWSPSAAATPARHGRLPRSRRPVDRHDPCRSRVLQQRREVGFEAAGTRSRPRASPAPSSPPRPRAPPPRRTARSGGRRGSSASRPSASRRARRARRACGSTPMPSWVSSCSSAPMRLVSFTASSAASLDRRDALGERGRDREHGQLVDDRLGAGDLDAVQRRGLDADRARPAPRPGSRST